MSFVSDYGISILTGDRLLADAAQAAPLRRRDCFAGLKRYLDRPAGKVMLLSGLRRTGKTYMARQAVASLPESALKETVFVRFPYSEDGFPRNEASRLFDDLYDAGFRRFFVDECTSVREFPAWAKRMADDFADIGCHVVLLGTDSLSMHLARNDALEGRYCEIRTTRIPFHEWKRLLEYAKGRDLSVKDYLYYGGILDFDGIPVETALVPEAANPFRSPESISRYLYSAAALNLQNTVARNLSPKFASLHDLWQDGRLVEAVMRAVQDQNHRLAGKELAERFRHDDFNEALHALKKYGRDIRRLAAAEEDRMLDEIEDRLCISRRRLNLKKEDRIAVMRYLHRIDVFADAAVRIMPSADPRERSEYELWRESSRIIQTQPGIRTGQMRLACDIAWRVLAPHVSFSEAEFRKSATSMVEGQMLEDVVFADIKDALPAGCDIFKLEWEAGIAEAENKGEFDVAVLDRRNPAEPKISLFEVKHADESRGGEARHMKNPRIIAQVAGAFGRVASRTIIYNGETERRAVLYVNAGEFLGSIGRDPEAALFPQESETWRPKCPLEPWMAEASASGRSRSFGQCRGGTGQAESSGCWVSVPPDGHLEWRE